MKLAVVPARGGSKRIPRKNVKEFCGKPMIAWSIDAALESGCFDHVVVSTDDEEIAEVARACGAEVPFIRPAELADDYTATTPVIAHAIEWHRARGETASEVCCIYATAPLIRSSDVRRGLVELQRAGCDYAFSVASYAFPVQRAVRITLGGRVEMFDPSQFLVRSQDLEHAFHDAGQFYWGSADAWLNARPIFSDGSIPIVVPRHRVQDIDTQEDWEVAEWLFRAIRQS